MKNDLRYKFVVGLIVMVISASSIGLASFLGKSILQVLQTNSNQSHKIQNQSVESVSTNDEIQTYNLTPVPVFFIQTGVFTETSGAEEGAGPLRKLGYEPYVTKNAPYKVWLGLYKNRETAEFMKKELLDHGISSFTASLVLNGISMKATDSNAALLKDVFPLLELYTKWVQDNLELSALLSTSSRDQQLISEQIEKLKKEPEKISLQKVSKNTDAVVGEEIKSLNSQIFAYSQELQHLQANTDQWNNGKLQGKILEFIDYYGNLSQVLENYGKT